MISVQEARDILQQNLCKPQIKELLLLDATGFTLANDVIAICDIPNFTQSNVDGYAFKYNGSNTFMLTGEMAAGTSEQISITDGEATRIFTGAPLPNGADTVVMQEKVSVNSNTVFVNDASLKTGSNVRPKGAEVKQGELAMAAGTVLTPAALGFLAGIGITHVSVFVPPSITIILTGNELQLPGQPLSFGQVYESNSVLLTAALQKAGIKDINILRATDSIEILTNVLNNTLNQSDMVLLTGGVSVGDYDFVTKAAASCGVEKKFHRIKQKPGKPLYFGKKQDKAVFGLPGNPSSVLTCFYEYVLPYIKAVMQQKPSVIQLTAIITNDYKKPAGLTHFLKAVVNGNKVIPLHAQESFRLHSFAQANCFIVLGQESEGCTAGDAVNIHLLPL